MGVPIVRGHERGTSVTENLQVGETFVRPIYCHEHKCKALAMPDPSRRGSFIHVCTGKTESLHDIVQQYGDEKPAKAHYLVESPNLIYLILAQSRSLYMKYFKNFRETNPDSEWIDNKEYLPFLNFIPVEISPKEWHDLMVFFEGILVAMEMGEEDFDETR